MCIAPALRSSNPDQGNTDDTASLFLNDLNARIGERAQRKVYFFRPFVAIFVEMDAPTRRISVRTNELFRKIISLPFIVG